MLKIGVIGYGGRMHNIINITLKTGKCELTAIADLNADKIEAELSKEFPNTHYYKDAEEMLENEKLDGVFIGTRCSTHAHFAVLTAKYNVPFFFGKARCHYEGIIGTT